MPHSFNLLTQLFLKKKLLDEDEVRRKRDV